MPEIGEIARGNKLGCKGKRRHRWSACEKCGKERWVSLYFYERGKSRVCRPCSNLIPKHYSEYKYQIKYGYFVVWLHPQDFFRPMAWRSGYILEHRLIMAQHLGRCLQRWEIVHHINGDKKDNRVENLQLMSDDRHKQITILGNRISHLEQRLTMLEAENILLRSEVPTL